MVSNSIVILGFEISTSTYIFLHVMLGAVLMEIFSLAKGFDGAKPWLRDITGWSERAVFRSNAVLVVIVGTLVGSALVNPTTRAQALTAGLGWVGLLNTGAARGKRLRSSNDDGSPEEES
jgi:hypothetical protein